MYPTLFHIGHLSLPTYGLLVAIGLIAALNLSRSTATRVGLSPDRLWDAGVFAVVSAFVLSRLLLIALFFHSFLTYPILLLMLPSLTPLGVLLTGFASLAYLRSKRTPLRAALDAWAPPLTLFWSFLALGHFAEGSDPGLPTTSPLSLPIPPYPARLHPVTLFATLCALALTALLLLVLPRRAASTSARVPSEAASTANFPPSRILVSPHVGLGSAVSAPGSTAALGLALAGLTEFLLSFLREPASSQFGTPQPGSLVPAWAALLDPIQWLALGLIAAGTLLYLTRQLAPRDPAPQRPLPHAI